MSQGVRYAGGEAMQLDFLAPVPGMPLEMGMGVKFSYSDQVYLNGVHSCSQKSSPKRKWTRLTRKWLGGQSEASATATM